MSGWLVIGASGMLGRELVTDLRRDHEGVVGLAHRELDITDEAAIDAAVRSSHPDVVVNCAAWTAVDDAEMCEDAALLVNGHGARYLAEASADRGARFVQLSTDYVFGGDVRRPYAENDATAPGTAYGPTKLAGEAPAPIAVPSSPRSTTQTGDPGRSPTVTTTQRPQPHLKPLISLALARDVGQTCLFGYDPHAGPKTVLKPAVRTMLVPVPEIPGGGEPLRDTAIGGQSLRDTGLLAWCGEVIRSVFADLWTRLGEGTLRCFGG